jgi:hypothetical protein
MSEFSEQIVAEIELAGINNYDQRSALGLMRTWVDKRQPHQRVDYGSVGARPTKRDDLVDKLIVLFEEAALTADEYVEALAEARAWVNAPFFDPTMNGAQSRKTTMKPGAAKKMKEKEEK